MLQGSERWTIGVSMALLNCALSSIGITLQRKSHLLGLRDEAGPESPGADKAPAHSFRPMWVLGVVTYILAAAPDVVAYAMVPQVVCTTVACFRLVVVTILGHFFLQESVQRREIIGMTACTIGTFLCLVYGPKPSGEDRLSEAGGFYHPEVFTYLVLALSVLCFLLVIEHADMLCLPKLPQTTHYIILPAATGLAYGVEKVFNTEIGFMRSPDNLPWGIASHPQWAAMAAAILALGLTDFYLNLRGAKQMPMKLFVPTAFAFGTALQYFQSVFVFGELREMNVTHAVLSICGAIASLVGAIGIQPPQVQPPTDHKLIDTDGFP